MTRKPLIAAAAILATTITACGGTTTTHTNGYNRPAAPHYTEQQVADMLDLHLDSSGISYSDPKEECVAFVIMVTAAQVHLYADAGDPVATNPAGDVGVKVGVEGGDVDEQVCFDRFQTALKALT
jgi:hypothetical protein